MRLSQNFSFGKAALNSAFLSARITGPSVKTVLTLKDIPGGEGDLTQTVDIHSNDEIGDLARYFNATLEKIKNLVVTIKNQTVSLFNIGNEPPRGKREPKVRRGIFSFTSV